MKALYAKLRDHFQKIVSGLGMALLGIDLANYAAQLNSAAGQFLPEKWTRIVGFVCFALVFVRATAVTWQKK